MRLKHIIGVAFLALASLCDASQKVLGGDKKELRNPLDENFQKQATSLLEEWHVPGLAIAVVDGDLTWAAGYGNASLDLDGSSAPAPVTPSTLFYGGSTTKAFLAAALSLMIDSGNYTTPDPDLQPLTWKTPISSLIRDDFVLMDEYTWEQDHLTIEDALTHRTGFPRHDKSLGLTYSDDRGDGTHNATVRDFTRSLRHLPMTAEPRMTWRYCNIMFMVLSHVFQTLNGGRWIGDVFEEWIWEPLGMNSTFLSVEDALAAVPGLKLADGYYWDYERSKFESIPFSSLSEASGAGGIVSNVLDYARWLRCMFDEAGPMSKKGHAAIKEPRMNMGPDTEKGYDAPMSYAFGWMTSTWKGHKVYTHSGGMEAYGTEVYFLPGLRYGIVTFGNTATTSAMVGNILIWKLINDKLGVPEGERYDWATRGKESLNRLLSSSKTAVDDLYPKRAHPPVPRALPLADYAGTYFHPAYQNITIEVTDSGSQTNTNQRRLQTELKADRGHFVWPMTFEFKHVSGEFWVIFIDMKKAPNMLNGQVARAEFKIGATGGADELVVEFMEDGSEGLVTFKRVK